VAIILSMEDFMQKVSKILCGLFFRLFWKGLKGFYEGISTGF
jgi:hypothetical protein